MVTCAVETGRSSEPPHGSRLVDRIYDRLADLVSGWQSIGVLAAVDDGEASRLLVTEARLLDDRRHREWLSQWAEDGTLWVPLGRATHPADDQAYFLDDVHRLRERIARWDEPSAWSLRPAPETVRIVANIESFTLDAELRVRSAVVLHEHRGDAVRSWAMRQYHLFSAPDGDGRRMLRAKVLVVPALHGAVPHTAVLL